MTNPEHLKIIDKGVEMWNTLRPYLANLTYANLSKRNLSGIDFRETDLSFANLRGVNLSRANLRDATLYGTDLTGANLREVNLENTVLEFTNFTQTNFSKADFKNAIVEKTTFADCNLTGAYNLDECHHRRGSTIDHFTLAISENLPLKFLRGCGLPDFIIENVSVIQGKAIQYYSCFISYSKIDEDFANRLYADLQNNGVRCWYAPEDMLGGKKLYDQINEAIRIHDKLLLVLSEHSMNSNWVSTEIKKARTREKHEGRQMLFPISITPFEDIKKWELFNSDEGRDLASEIRSYYIPDFSNWKNHDGYYKEFQKLIKSLKGESIK